MQRWLRTLGMLMMAAVIVIANLLAHSFYGFVFATIQCMVLFGGLRLVSRQRVLAIGLGVCYLSGWCLTVSDDRHEQRQWPWFFVSEAMVPCPFVRDGPKLDARCVLRVRWTRLSVFGVWLHVAD